jgi:hypothetical protein
MVEKCPACGSENLMDGYTKCADCGHLIRTVTVEDFIKLKDEVTAVNKQVTDLKQILIEWDDLRLSALQLFLGLFPTLILFFVGFGNNWLMSIMVSFAVTSVTIFLVVGVLKYYTIGFMDILTLKKYKQKNK